MDSILRGEEQVNPIHPKNFTPETIKAIMKSPEMQNVKPQDLVSTLSGMFGLDVTPISDEETARIRAIYFQVITLEKDNWTKLPGIRNYVQIAPFKLKEIPPESAMVADVLIDKSDYEAECFDKYIKNMTIRGKSIVFYSISELPIDITIGLKCVNQRTREVVPVDDRYFRGTK